MKNNGFQIIIEYFSGKGISELNLFFPDSRNTMNKKVLAFYTLHWWEKKF